VRVTLDAMDAAFRDVRKKGSDPFSCRWRVEHAQVVQPRDFDRFATLGIVASMQPTHATSDGPWAPARVGAERMKGAYAWRRFLDLGVPLAFGSDFPVESVDPRLGLYAAVTRRAPSDPNGPVFGPSPPLSKEEALAAFTSGAAFAGFHEGDRGAFAIGAAADLTVFDSDPFAPGAPPEAILRAGVVWTVIGGEVEFPRDAAH
ncbi:MAG TPA: amidohydrolase family protein, partial [Planctomycetota bacterium]|nr:amidohydrolase family protein [Planctomycetota bacterium]